MAQIILPTGAVPATPTAGNVTVYAKTDGFIYGKDSAGVETPLSAVAAASAITNTPAGSIAATTVQAAINELDSEKSPIAGSASIVTTGALNAGSITSGFGSIDIGTDALTAGSGTFSSTVSVAPATAATHAVPLAQTIGKNLIINGNMSIYQRGTAAVTTYAYGPSDRWITGAVGDTFSTTQGSFVSGDTLFDTGGAQYFTQIVVTSVAGAANYIQFVQRIEDVRKTAGKTVTVSFWAKVDSGTPSIGLEIAQSFGAGGSAIATGTGQAQALTTTWNKYSKTFNVPSINGKTIGTETTHYTNLIFWLDAGSDFNTRAGSIGQSSKTVSIAQVQLEVSPVATAFEHRPYGYELALCQRYFRTSYNIGVALGGASMLGAVTHNAASTSSYAGVYVPFDTPMRSTPNITLYNPVTAASATWRNITSSTNIAAASMNIGERGFTAYINTSSLTSNQYAIHYSAEREL